MAKHKIVEVPASNLKKEITKILFDKGYILNYKFIEEGPQGTIKIALKYDPQTKVSAIQCLKRGYRSCIYIQRCNDRQGGFRTQGGWRSSLLCLLIKEDI